MLCSVERPGSAKSRRLRSMLRIPVLQPKGLIMSLSFHIDYDGRCEEAFNFYAAHLGGTIGTMLKIAESPIPVSAARPGNHIVHANIRIDGVEWPARMWKRASTPSPLDFTSCSVLLRNRRSMP